MKRTCVFALVFILGAYCFAQTPTPPPNPSTNSPSFTLTATVMSLPANGQTSVATDIGGTFAVTKNILLRSDNILSPDVGLSANFGGVQYTLPTEKLFGKTNLDPQHFQMYVTGSLGQSRVSTTGFPDKSGLAGLAGGGVNYDPSGAGHFSLNLVEARWAKLPGLSNSTVIVSTGLKLGW
jgi:hypothetical protein